MKDKEIIIKDVKGKVEKIMLSTIKEIKVSILESYRVFSIEIITDKKTIKSVSYLNNSDDPLTSTFIEILRYFYDKKASRKWLYLL